MPIDFTQPLKTFDGANMTEVAVGPDGKPTTVVITLSRISCMALLGAAVNEPSADADEHLERFLLAQKIRDNKSAVLSSEEITRIKTRIARSYNNAILTGQAVAMLDEGAVAKIKAKSVKAA